MNHNILLVSAIAFLLMINLAGAVELTYEFDNIHDNIVNETIWKNQSWVCADFNARAWENNHQIGFQSSGAGTGCSPTVIMYSNESYFLNIYDMKTYLKNVTINASLVKQNINAGAGNCYAILRAFGQTLLQLSDTCATSNADYSIWDIVYDSGSNDFEYFDDGVSKGNFNPVNGTFTFELINNAGAGVLNSNVSVSVLNYTLRRTTLINLTSPVDNAISIANLNNFTLNISTPSIQNRLYFNLSNATIYVWNNAGSVVNQTFQAITGKNNITNFSDVVITGFGNFDWNVEVCTVEGGCEFADSNLTLNLANVTEEYEPILIEGEDTGLNMNITFENIDTSLLARLWWNNTAYIPTKTVISTDTVRFAYSLSVPVGIGNLTGVQIPHLWNYYLPDMSVNANTTAQNQTVYSVTLDDCTTNSNLVFNYTLYDEGTREIIDGNNTAVNGTIEVDIDVYNLDRSILLEEYSHTFSPNRTALICINNGILGNTSLSVDTVVSYTAVNYVTEFHHFDNLTVSSATIPHVIGLYPLLLDDSTTVLLEYRDEDGLRVDNAVIQIERRYVGDGVYIGVERSKQDQNGQTQGHFVEEDVIYRFRVFLNGVQQYLSSDYNIRCIAGEVCSIEIKAGADVSDFDTEYDNLPEGTYSITVDKTARNVTLAFNLVELGTMNLTIYEIPFDDNLGDKIITSGSLTANSGSITVHVPETYDNRTFYAVIFLNGDHIGSSYIDLTSDSFDYFGTWGIFLGALLVLALALIGLSQGELVILWTVFGVIVAGALKLFNLDWMAGMGLVAVAVVLLIKLSVRNKTR